MDIDLKILALRGASVSLCELDEMMVTASSTYHVARNCPIFVGWTSRCGRTIVMCFTHFHH